MPDINAPELVIGTVAGLTAPVLKGVYGFVKKTAAYEETRESVESKVNCLAAISSSAEAYNAQLGDRNLGGSRQGEGEDLLKKTIKGKEVIQQMGDKPQIPLKAHYTNLLNEVDESIKGPLEVFQAQGVINGMENLLLTKEINKDIKGTSVDVKEALLVTKDTSKDVKAVLPVLMENTKVTKDTSTGVKDMNEAFPVIMKNTEVIMEIADGLQQYVATDGKENLTVTKGINEGMAEALPLIKDTSEAVKGLPDLIKDSTQNVIAQIRNLLRSERRETGPEDDSDQPILVSRFMKILQRHPLAGTDIVDQLGLLTEADNRGATLGQLNDAVTTESGKEVMTTCLIELQGQLVRMEKSICELIEKNEKDKTLEEQRNSRMQLEVGVEIVGNRNKVELKSAIGGGSCFGKGGVPTAWDVFSERRPIPWEVSC